MKIHWGRILIAGLVAETLGVLIYQIVVRLYGRGTTSTLIVVVGSFVLMFFGALWAGRKIESRFLLHGFFVGVVAIVYYVIGSLPMVLMGQYPVNYWMQFS